MSALPSIPTLVARWQRLPWPLPALLTWAVGWAAWHALLAAGLAASAALPAGLLAAGLLAAACAGAWRRAIAAVGFPLSLLALGAAPTVPGWLWALPLLPLMAVYPLRTWRDAPLFPTPNGALDGLDAVVGRPGRVLDAGCGLGHGLIALHRLWPRACVEGIEWSPLLAAWAALRCRWARVQRGDMWALSWAGADLVYVFQRPESMVRVHDKAAREMAPGGWLVSLEFAVPGVAPVACLQGPGRRPLWVYRPSAGSTEGVAGR